MLINVRPVGAAVVSYREAPEVFEPKLGATQPAGRKLQNHRIDYGGRPSSRLSLLGPTRMFAVLYRNG